METTRFVAVLGASNYTYAEATLHRDLPNWIGSHVRAFEFLGACPEIVVPDNWKTGVTCACRYEPELNQTYSEMAQHYGVAIIPARPSQTKRQGKSGTGSFVGRTLAHCRPTPPDVLR